MCAVDVVVGGVVCASFDLFIFVFLFFFSHCIVDAVPAACFHNISDSNNFLLFCHRILGMCVIPGAAVHLKISIVRG